MADQLNVSILMRLVDGVTGPVREIAKSFQAGQTALQAYKEKADHLFENAEHIHQAGEGVAALHEKLEKLREVPIEHAMKFEVAITKLGLGAKDASLGPAALTETLTKMAAGTEYSSTQVAQALYVLKRGTGDVTSAMTQMPKVMEFAAAHMMDLGEATQLSTNLMRSFKIPADQTESALDAITVAAKQAGVPIQEFAPALNNLGPMARAAGVSLNGTATVMSALAKSGLSGEQSASAMHSILTRLSGSNPRAMKMVGAALGQIGVSAFDAHGKLRALPDLMSEIGKKTKGLTDKQKLSGFGAVFGPEASSMMKNFFDSLKPEELDQLTEKIRESEGAAHSQAHALSETAEVTEEKLSAAFDTLNTSIGTALLPGFKSWRKVLLDLVVGFTTFVANHPTLIAVLGRLFSIVVALTGALATLISVIATARAAQAVYTLATGYVKLAMAMRASMISALAAAAPFLAVAAAVAAISLAVAELIKYWKQLDFGEVFRGIKETFKEGGQFGITNVLKETFDPTALFNDVTSAIGGNTQTVAGGHETKVGGDLNIHVTSDGEAHVQSLRKDGPMDINVDAGVSMVGAH